MAGKIFYRERRKVEKGDKKPRYTICAVYDTDLTFIPEHFKRTELEQIAKAVGAELSLLDSDHESHSYHESKTPDE